MTTFARGVGRWVGSAEVYDGRGRFVGNGMDMRHVQTVDPQTTRIDVSFIGPFKASGHYFIRDEGDYRLYQGPVNVGYAETLSQGLVSAHAYWPSLGLSQRFFLMVLPDDQTQLSLALMSRGEELLYAVVGENKRVGDDNPTIPHLVSGTAYDLADDPTAGRGGSYLFRRGLWAGTVTCLDAERQVIGTVAYEEGCDENTCLTISGSWDGAGYRYALRTNGWQAWTPASGEAVASFSLYGGRALSGQVYDVARGLRCWRREVVASDGLSKAIVHIWYRGDARVGYQFGLLTFSDVNA